VSNTTPPGWYPDSQVPGQQRYWDGTQWTDHTAPAAPTAPTVFNGQPAPNPGFGATADQPAKKNWFLRHKIVSGVLAVVIIAIIAAAAGSGGGDSDDTSDSAKDSSTSAASEPSPSDDAAESAEPEPEPEPESDSPEPADEPELTVSQENAVSAAENYLSIAGFSEQGLIDQLSSDYGDGFPRKDAIVAVKSLDVDWNEQAVRSAENYLDIGGFSRQGLIDQLSSPAGDKYTVKQATYAADQVGL
jgi:hypothetical protein